MDLVAVLAALGHLDLMVVLVAMAATLHSAVTCQPMAAVAVGEVQLAVRLDLVVGVVALDPLAPLDLLPQYRVEPLGRLQQLQLLGREGKEILLLRGKVNLAAAAGVVELLHLRMLQVDLLSTVQAEGVSVLVLRILRR